MWCGWCRVIVLGSICQWFLDFLNLKFCFDCSVTRYSQSISCFCCLCQPLVLSCRLSCMCIFVQLMLDLLCRLRLMMPFHRTLSFLVLCLVALVAQALTPYKDTPFPQIVAQRFLFFGQPQKATWPILAVPHIQQFAVIASPRFGEQFWLVGNRGLRDRVSVIDGHFVCLCRGVCV